MTLFVTLVLCQTLTYTLYLILQQSLVKHCYLHCPDEESERFRDLVQFMQLVMGQR